MSINPHVEDTLREIALDTVYDHLQSDSIEFMSVVETADNYTISDEERIDFLDREVRRILNEVLEHFKKTYL